MKWHLLYFSERMEDTRKEKPHCVSYQSIRLKRQKKNPRFIVDRRRPGKRCRLVQSHLYPDWWRMPRWRAEGFGQRLIEWSFHWDNFLRSVEIGHFLCVIYQLFYTLCSLLDTNSPLTGIPSPSNPIRPISPILLSPAILFQSYLDNGECDPICHVQWHFIQDAEWHFIRHGEWDRFVLAESNWKSGFLREGR
jgi:hypothetical protein